jgi:hypothetical protein
MDDFSGAFGSQNALVRKRWQIPKALECGSNMSVYFATYSEIVPAINPIIYSRQNDSSASACPPQGLRGLYLDVRESWGQVTTVSGK